MNTLEAMFRRSKTAADYAGGYFARMTELGRAVDAQALAKAIAWVEESARQGQTMYLIANGGSSSVASHFVNDIVPNSLKEGQPPFRAFSLTDNGESVTAVGNDSGFENIFLLQLKALLRRGDLVWAMSVSGNSENLIRAVEYANGAGARTMGMCGFDGGRLAKAAQLPIVVTSTKDEYGPVEDMFALMCHIISGYLTMKWGRMLHH